LGVLVVGAVGGGGRLHQTRTQVSNPETIDVNNHISVVVYRKKNSRKKNHNKVFVEG